MESTHTRTHAHALSHAYTLIPAHSEIIGQCATSSFCTSCFMILRLAEEPITLTPPPPSSNWIALCSRFGNTRGRGVSATRFRDVVQQIGAWSRMCVRASVCGCGWVVGVRQHTDRVGVGERGGAEWGRVRGGHGAATEREKYCGLYVSSDHGRVAAGRRVNIFNNWIHRRHMVFAGPRTCRYQVLEAGEKQEGRMSAVSSCENNSDDRTKNHTGVCSSSLLRISSVLRIICIACFLSNPPPPPSIFSITQPSICC